MGHSVAQLQTCVEPGSRHVVDAVVMQGVPRLREGHVVPSTLQRVRNRSHQRSPGSSTRPARDVSSYGMRHDWDIGPFACLARGQSQPGCPAPLSKATEGGEAPTIGAPRATDSPELVTSINLILTIRQSADSS